MTHVKELYMCKSFEELEKNSDIKKNNLKPNLILNSIMKLYKAGEEARLEGDEEKCYVYLMRIMNIVQYIRKSSEFEKLKKEVNDMLGGKSGVERLMDTLENVIRSLRRRYELKAMAEKQEKMDCYLDSTETTLPVSHVSTTLPSPSLSFVISYEELKEKLMNSGVSMLIFDCRPREDFLASRIKYNFILNVPEEILYQGTYVSKIVDSFNEEEKKIWTSRGYKENLVVMDYNSTEFVRDSPIQVFKQILEIWDQEFVEQSEKKSLKLLVGGYEGFQLRFPALCENPHYKPKPSVYDFDRLNDIEYPLNDLEYEPFSAPSKGQPNVPSIDRASKKAALRTYEEKEQQIHDLVTEQEKIMDKSIATEKERLNAEDEWKKLNQTSIIKEEPTNESESREQALLHRIMELEIKAKDLKEENDSMKMKQEEIIKKESATKEEAEKLARQLQSLEAKEKERNLIEEEQARKQKEREKFLAQTRQQKKLEKQSFTENIENVAPFAQVKQPFIPDRGSKPALRQYELQKVRRNFSPVRGGPGKGLTGLKNLGNTCYMNSIIQCLSNTQSLCEYFCNGVYIKHRNSSSKTQCQIVEEVAAVIKELHENHKFISSKDLKRIVGIYEKNFKGAEQQDSHEFLTILMDWLHSDLQAIFINDSPRGSLADKAWNEYTKQRESVILNLFYGQIKSTVECEKCQKFSATYDVFSNLSLELPQDTNRTTIKRCLELYFNGERVSGWMCPNCKDKRTAFKKLEFARLPAVLVVHLKRFYADPDMGGYRKKQNYVEFPLNDLDVRQHLARSEQQRTVNANTTYNLYAVSNHYGSMEGGHYTAFCKNQESGRWYKFDDHHVTEINASDVNSSAAYILFYQMAPRLPPSLSR